ncbi:unnamed protein product [Hyaloperonospora brassicae]|uniref:Cytosol aminopeptidase domain-containing protein n=1 Tax=Hyaloperonospora brassicae TaxID=162125 RepID=A0AAV0ULQ4_HYABA|nr:unnamed protein product [Hyaloperonospora brassicae]
MVHFTSLAALPPQRVNRVVVVGDAPPNTQLLQYALDTLRPGPDSGATASLLLLPTAAASADPLSLTLHALPTALSRANCPARPHALTSFLKRHTRAIVSTASPSAPTDALSPPVVLVLLVLPTHSATWFAAGAAVARAAPLYAPRSPPPGALHVLYAAPLTAAQQTLVQHTADGVRLAARLVDAPPNELHVDAFVAEAQAVAARTGARVTLIRGDALRLAGFGGLYGVGKAAAHAPALVCLSHVPPAAAADAPSVAMVGKGIVFDTGGLSLKTGGAMAGMKRDMAGAAALLAAFDAACCARNTTDRVPLHAVLCVAENAVGPLATRVDDVLELYSGKRVEVNNTDAEGRLVLADGVAYAVRHLNPKVVVDMATLTGAQGVATGTRIGAVYSNDAQLEQMAVRAGRASGDLVHPMAYAPELYRDEFESAIADMKNSVKHRANGQVACAGQFIANHLGDFEHSGKWLHVDMAYPAFTSDDERATGYGVAFMQALLKEIDGADW